MKSLIVLAMLVFPGQATTAPVAGTWTAQFEGKTFATLKLESTAGRLTGGLTIGDAEFDTKGALKRVGEPPRELKPIFDVKQSGSVVAFSRRDVDDIDRFEFRILTDNRAELRLLLSDDDLKELAAEGVPPPGPIQFTKR